MSSSARKVFFNVPNIVTFTRIAVIPLIMILMMMQGEDQTFERNRFLCLLSAAFFILAGISDLVDGYYARRYKMVSLVGKFFDPMADKLVMMTVMVMMIPMGRLPAWLVVVLLFREILISGLRSIAAGEGIIIDAGKLGKRKTAWFNVGLSALLIYYPFFTISAYTIGWIAMIIGSLYSFISGFQYLYFFFKKMAETKKL